MTVGAAAGLSVVGMVGAEQQDVRRVREQQPVLRLQRRGRSLRQSLRSRRRRRCAPRNIRALPRERGAARARRSRSAASDATSSVCADAERSGGPTSRCRCRRRVRRATDRSCAAPCGRACRLPRAAPCPSSGRRGRPCTASLRRPPFGGLRYPLTVSGSHAIGVDLGGTKILAGVVTRSGELLRRHERPTPKDSQESVIRELQAAVAELMDDEVAAIGVGVPAPIDQPRGVIVESVNVLLADVPLRDLMSEPLRPARRPRQRRERRGDRRVARGRGTGASTTS